MSWKCGVLLIAALGIGPATVAEAADAERARPFLPLPRHPTQARPAPLLGQAFYPPIRPPYSPGWPGTHPHGRKDLERHIERTIKGHLGHSVRDVDVDVDPRRRRVDVDVEIRHRFAYGQLRQLLYSMPELYGYQIRLDVDWDD